MTVDNEKVNTLWNQQRFPLMSEWALMNCCDYSAAYMAK